MDPKRRPTRQKGPSGSFGDYVKRRRETLGLTATALADQLGVSKSFVSLIESGARVPGDVHVRRLAEILGDDPDALAAWVRGEGVAGDTAEDLFTSTLEPLARFETQRSQRALGVSPSAPVNVEVRLASPQAISFERPQSSGSVAWSRMASPAQPPGRRIPFVAEGTCPDTTEDQEAHEYVRLDPSVLPKGERLVSPFAWRLTPEGTRYAPDVLQADDTVIISRAAGQPVPDELYAVRDRDGTVLLGRVLHKDDVLIIQSPEGKAEKALHAHGASPLSLIVGKVVAIIRPWHYTVFRPGSGGSDRK